MKNPALGRALWGDVSRQDRSAAQSRAERHAEGLGCKMLSGFSSRPRVIVDTMKSAHC